MSFPNPNCHAGLEVLMKRAAARDAALKDGSVLGDQVAGTHYKDMEGQALYRDAIELEAKKGVGK